MECAQDHRLTLPAHSLHLGQIREFSRGVFCAYTINRRAVRQMVLAIDEAAANVIEHAYPPGENRDLDLSISVLPNRVVIELRDTGKQFNPCQCDPGHSRSRRRGYGLSLIRRIVDEINYQRSKTDENVLTMVKHVETA